MPSHRLSLPAAAVLLTAAAASAQCGLSWSPSGGVPGTSDIVHAIHTWDPDGAGPAQPVFVVGGAFTQAGGLPANHVAVWDPAAHTWSTLGVGMDGDVTGFATLANGQLVACGAFAHAGTSPTPCAVALWTGTDWTPLATNLSSQDPTWSTPLFGDPWVAKMVVLPNGDLVAVGYFFTISGVAANHIARWNGTTWAPVGAGFDLPATRIVRLANGDLVAAGYFNSAGGTPANGIARWNGAAWQSMGGAGSVWDLAVLPNGNLVAGGIFTSIGGIAATGVAQWNGTQWSNIGGSQLNATFVNAMHVRANGELLATGLLTLGGSVASLARWNGTTWTEMPPRLTTTITAFAELGNGDLLAGGDLATDGRLLRDNIARYDGQDWHPLTSGPDGDPRAFAALGGDLVVAGDFTGIGPVAGEHIARRTPAGWVALGTGPDGPVRALAVMPNGDLVAGGSFAQAGGAPAAKIARWNGAAWSPLGAGIGGTLLSSVHALATLPSGDLVAAGAFQTAGGAPANNIARWNGTAWLPLGAGIAGEVHALAVLQGGDLVAGGQFVTAGGINATNIARWNGTSWQPLGAGLSNGSAGLGVTAFAVLQSGDLVAAGDFQLAGSSAANQIARWNGVAWAPLGLGLGGGLPTCLLGLPNGDLLAGGAFTSAGLFVTERLARWNGTAWTIQVPGTNGAIQAMHLTASGSIAVGGTFTRVAGLPSERFAELHSDCAATGSVGSAGCSGSGGSPLAIQSLPWLGSQFRTIATGLPSDLAIRVMGFGTLSAPLPAIVPQGIPGCSLLVTPDFVDPVLGSAGTIASSVFVPNQPSLVGIAFHQQMAPLTFDLGGNLTAVGATNRLDLTIGSF